MLGHHNSIRPEWTCHLLKIIWYMHLPIKVITAANLHSMWSSPKVVTLISCRNLNFLVALSSERNIFITKQIQFSKSWWQAIILKILIVYKKPPEYRSKYFYCNFLSASGALLHCRTNKDNAFQDKQPAPKNWLVPWSRWFLYRL